MPSITSNNIFDEFKKVDEKYDVNSIIDYQPSEAKLNLEKFSYTPPSAEEIETEAKKSLQDYLQKSKTSIEDDYQTKLKSMLSEKEELAENVDSQKLTLENQVSSAKDNASKNALQRGLARSTIVVNQMAAFDSAKLSEFAKLDQEYTKTLTKLASEKSLLEVQKQNALSSFDIAYAVKISDKIANINAEVTSKIEEVTKLNNDIAKQEADFALALEKENLRRQQEEYDYKQGVAKDLQTNGVTTFDALKQEEKFKIALSYVNGMSKAEALSFVQDNQDLKNQLGSLYTRLHAAISAKVN